MPAFMPPPPKGVRWITNSMCFPIAVRRAETKVITCYSIIYILTPLSLFGHWDHWCHPNKPTRGKKKRLKAIHKIQLGEMIIYMWQDSNKISLPSSWPCYSKIIAPFLSQPTKQKGGEKKEFYIFQKMRSLVIKEEKKKKGPKFIWKSPKETCLWRQNKINCEL